MNMTLEDIIIDIHAVRQDMEAFERKYGVLSETFYQSFSKGEEPEDDSWVLDWAEWAGCYEIWQRRLEQYRQAIIRLNQKTTSIMDIIGRTARHERIAVTA